MRMTLVITTTLVVALLASLAWALTQPTRGPARSVAVPPVEANRLREHVEMLALTLQPRDSTSPKSMAKAADWITARLASTGARIEEQPFDEGRFRNVVAHYGPTEGARLIVGAHYDTAGALPGADDNASGVAALLELGRLLGTAELSAPVDLVAYALEEPPYFRTPMMGSAIHAASLAEAGTPVRAMIALEMLGYYSDVPGSQQFPIGALRLLYPGTGNFIAVVGRTGEEGLVRAVKRAMRSVAETQHPVPVESINAPPWLVGVDFSDHQSFWQHGYPALMVTDTSFYRNPHYHTSADLPDTLDYPRMATVVRQVYAAILALD